MNNSYVTEINSASFHLSARLAYKSSAETMKLKGECCTLNDFISGDFIFFFKLYNHMTVSCSRTNTNGGGGAEVIWLTVWMSSLSLVMSSLIFFNLFFSSGTSLSSKVVIWKIGIYMFKSCNKVPLLHVVSIWKFMASAYEFQQVHLIKLTFSLSGFSCIIASYFVRYSSRSFSVFSNLLGTIRSLFFSWKLIHKISWLFLNAWWNVLLHYFFFNPQYDFADTIKAGSNAFVHQYAIIYN